MAKKIFIIDIFDKAHSKNLKEIKLIKYWGNKTTNQQMGK